MIAASKNSDPAYIERLKRIFLDVYDELTCAHEDDEAVRKQKYVYPSILKIKKMINEKFSMRVGEVTLRIVRDTLIDDGDIVPDGKRIGNPKQLVKPSDDEIMTPVEDDPEEVSTWEPVIAHAALFRILPNPYVAKGKASKVKTSYHKIDKRVYKFQGKRDILAFHEPNREYEEFDFIEDSDDLRMLS